MVLILYNYNIIMLCNYSAIYLYKEEHLFSWEGAPIDETLFATATKFWGTFPLLEASRSEDKKWESHKVVWTLLTYGQIDMTNPTHLFLL